MIDLTPEEIPKLAVIVTLGVGCLDFARGVIHTFLLEYAGVFIMGLDLSFARENQLFLLGVFGISNYITGTFLILIALKARELIPYILVIIPTWYIVGNAVISRTVIPQAELGGLPMMLGYFIICILTAVSSFVVIYYRRRQKST
ncbi:MAG: hypothetical protein Q6364_12915 [Candidatus Hermodarchaeota archaeon]|nr:hypothetical protein [Candidatus Hermodarchaeota archaeon]